MIVHQKYVRYDLNLEKGPKNKATSNTQIEQYLENKNVSLYAKPPK